MPHDGTYSEEEVRAILDRALRERPSDGLSHEDLLAVASEVGVSADAVNAAAREIREERETEDARRRILARRKRGFGSHLWAFLVVNAVLFFVNALTTPGEWWVLFPVVFWGMALLFHARAALSSKVSERALRREKRQRARRHEGRPRAARAERPPVGRVRLPTQPAEAEPEEDVTHEPRARARPSPQR